MIGKGSRMKHLDHYWHLAELFAYPTADFGETVQQVQTLLDERYPRAGAELRPFTEFVATASLVTLEELYLRTFDVQAVTTLDIGYVLFGDDYKRGKLLVHLNREHQEAGNDCGNELADHLPNVLRLLAKMGKADLRQELVEKIVAPALGKIIGEFDPHKLQQKNQVYQKHHKTLLEQPTGYGVIYRHPLLAVYRTLQEDFRIKEPPEVAPTTADFRQTVGSEMKLEADEP
ncbi:MAG: hypothetical protein D6681_05625 [Calditrichaeota bacterium]|nr:MAG: hypothetical protein D6681_05625 [Calditrichota bacterium]